MPNLRIVSDNAIERATLTASSTAGGLSVGNLAAAQVYPVWRATARDARVTAVFDNVEPIGFVGLPFCNLSPTAQMRVRISGEQSSTNLLKYSEAFDNAAWTKSAGATVTANYGASPSGSTNSTRLQFSTANLSLSQGTSLTAGTVCSGSVWAKGVAGQSITVSSGGIDQLFVLSGAWQRLQANNKTATGGAFAISTLGGATARDLQVWGAQLETGALTTSYYPTAAAAATRPAGHIDNWQSYDYDSGLVRACPAPAVRLRGFTPAQAASAYAYGGGAYARHWLPVEIAARAVAVDITDPDNLQGYLEAGCMVASSFWSLTYNASAASVTMVDRTEISRSAAGGQLADPGTMSRKVPVDLRTMPSSDRATFLNLVRNSRAHPILLSVFPMDADAARERDFMVYGRRTKDSDLAYQFMNAYATTLEVEEI
jgi:hypothetical protein